MKTDISRATPMTYGHEGHKARVLVKNTFLHYDDIESTSGRPRTESCDATFDGSRAPKMNVEATVYEHTLFNARPDCVKMMNNLSLHESRPQGNSPDILPRNHSSSTSSTDYPQNDAPDHDEIIDWSHGFSTVMLRNIPNKYTQQMMLQVLNEQFSGLYDFFYLPIDFRNRCNVGYAFINFVHPYYAELFRLKFHGYKLGAFRSHKVCEVSWGRVQGLKANIEQYRNSAVMSVPLVHYKPTIFSNGQMVPFPEADGPLPSIKLRSGWKEEKGKGQKAMRQ